jgi:hypothetical protein
MKKVFFILTLLLSCNNLFSQTYEVRRVDDRPRPRTYSPTISTLDFAEQTGNVQSQMQAKYDTNYEKINAKISSIHKILTKMIQRHKSGVQILEEEQIEYIGQYEENLKKINKIKLTNNSSVNQALNYLDGVEGQLYEWL